MQKPTCKLSVLWDRILRCIDIEHRIQTEANAAILGVNLVESSHSCNDGSSNYSDVIKEKVVSANDAADAVEDGPPFPSIDVNDGGGDKAGEEDEKVAAANISVNVVITGEGTEGTAEVHPHTPLLPAFGSSRVSNAAAAAVSSSGSRGDTSRNLQPAPRRSPSSISYTSGGGAEERLKILPIANGGPSPRQRIRGHNRLKVGGGVRVI
jgi:hypothetical protein